MDSIYKNQYKKGKMFKGESSLVNTLYDKDSLKGTEDKNRTPGVI